MADSTLTKIADEVLKPTSSVISTLLAPKIARLQAWVTEKDIKSRLSKRATGKALDAYLFRLLKKVSYQTTILFPQQSLSLPVIYEPLTLLHRYRMSAVSVDDLSRQGARTFLIDDAGMGKSTFAKHFILDQFNKTDRIPILIELRRVASEQSLLDAIALELDSFGTAFDKEVLLRLIASGRFIIVLDGFDEISTQDIEKRTTEIEELANKCEESVLLVTSRRDVALPTVSESSVVRFEPLSKEQAIALLHRYDHVSGLDVGHRLVEEIDAVPKRFLETPLLVALLYRTFGFTNSISKRVSTFYEEIYDALYKGHDLTKAGFSREKASGLDFEDFRRLLRGFAFLMVAKQVEGFSTESSAIEFIGQAVKLTSIQPSSNSAFLNDLLVAVPLMFRDGSELRFLHKTLFEFYAAEYLAFVRGGESHISKILSGTLQERFIQTFEFLAELNPSLFRRGVARPLAIQIRDFTFPLGNEQADTILFVHEKIGFFIWTEENIVVTEHRGQIHRDVNITDPNWRLKNASFSWGYSNGKEYVVGMVSGERCELFPLAAWLMVTKPSNEVNFFNTNTTDFTEIVSTTPLQVWHTFDRNLEHEKRVEAERFFRMFSTRFYPFIGRSTVGLIIDKNIATKLLKTISQEEKNEDELDALLSV